MEQRRHRAAPLRWLWTTLPCLVWACTTPAPQGSPIEPLPQETLRAASPAQKNVLALKKLRQAQGAVAENRPEDALALYHQSLRLYEELGDKGAQAAVLSDLGLLHHEAGQDPKAREELTRAVALAREAKEPKVLLEALYNLGLIQYAQGDDDATLVTMGEALGLAREAKDGELEGLTLNARGNAQRRSNRLAPALEDYKAAAVLWAGRKNPSYTSVAWMNVGYCHALRQEPTEAAAAFQQALDALEGAPKAVQAELRPHLEGMMRLVQADPKRAKERVLELMGRKPAPPQP
jgi:tetratricopeptide (TPR) repeat protein